MYKYIALHACEKRAKRKERQISGMGRLALGRGDGAKRIRDSCFDELNFERVLFVILSATTTRKYQASES